MRKADRIKSRLLTGVAALILGVGILGWGFMQAAFVSCAESQAKVTAPKGANIRKEASASSEMVGGAENGKVLTVISQVQGSDGNTWYQVKSGDLTGYIRSDLVEVSEGSVPAEGGEEGSGGGTAAPSDVTAVNPMSAAVSGESGKIRDSASSEGQILAEVPAETVLTVTGQAADADGRTWYQVSVTIDETQVNGFIRYDYVTLAGELTPADGAPAEPEEPEEPEETQPETKPYDTLLQDGDWLLVDNTGSAPTGYSIKLLFDSVENNSSLLEDSEKTVKSQKVIIIILVFLLVAAVAGIAFLVYKLRDMMDSAYFNEVEKETIRRKSSSAERNGQRNPRTSGSERTVSRPSGARAGGYGQEERDGSRSQRVAGSSQRSAGSERAGGTDQRVAGSSQRTGQRPAGSGQRSAGSERAGETGQRLAGSGQRSAGETGQRMAGSGQRSAGSDQRAAGSSQRSAGSSQRPGRPAQEPRPAESQGPRTMGASQGVQRQAGASQETRRPAGATQQGQRTSDSFQDGRGTRQGAQTGTGKVQPKNFMADDDDYEDGFLDYDE